MSRNSDTLDAVFAGEGRNPDPRAMERRRNDFAGKVADDVIAFVAALRSIRHNGDELNIGRARSCARRFTDEPVVEWLTEWVDDVVKASPEAPAPISNPAELPSVTEHAPLTVAQTADLERIAGLSPAKVNDRDAAVLAAYMAQTAGTPDNELVARAYNPVAERLDARHAETVRKIAETYVGLPVHADLAAWAKTTVTDALVGTDDFADVPEQHRRAAAADAAEAKVNAAATAMVDAPDLSMLSLAPSGTTPVEDRLAAGRADAKAKLEAERFTVS